MKRRHSTSLFLRMTKRLPQILPVIRSLKRLSQIQLGRIFRQMCLPFWTFLGVGVAGWWFDNADALIETFVRQFLKLNGQAPRWQAYLPPLVMFLIPCAVVLAIGLWQSTRHQLTHMKFIS